MKRIVVALLSACALLSSAVAAFAQDPTELLRADLRANKTAIVTSAMALDEAQSEAFWPIYREYEAELIKLNDESLAMVKDYAANYTTMTDETAKDLLKRGFKVREGRTKLLKKYSGKIEKSLGSKVAARWVQVEHALQAAIDMQMASELPLIKK
ncbi:MAG TPA: hypothetical protein VFU38_04630 [Candidatus Krumholzibacteria bacterium]|nr:hypothetical protein [Candidatus Krumholzibacteria bacterium]